jgi:DnaJ-class molecular chaperone
MDDEDIPIGEGDETESCPTCDGSGISDEDGGPCEDCGGCGYTEI